MHGLHHSVTRPRGVILRPRPLAVVSALANVGKSNFEVAGGEKRIRELLVRRQRLPTSGRIVPVRHTDNELITNKRIGSLETNETAGADPSPVHRFGSPSRIALRRSYRSIYRFGLIVAKRSSRLS